MSKYYDSWQIACWLVVGLRKFCSTFGILSDENISRDFISFNLKIGRHWILHSIGSKLTIICSSLHSAEKIYGKIMPRPVTWFIESLLSLVFCLAWLKAQQQNIFFNSLSKCLNYCFLTKLAKTQTLLKLFGKLYPRWRNWIEMHLESV